MVDHYGQLFDAYFEQRNLIPQGQHVEIAFEDLDNRPLETIEEIYRALNLPDFATARPAVSDYLDSLADYQKNERKPPFDRVKAALKDRWSGCFAEWGYEVN